MNILNFMFSNDLDPYGTSFKILIYPFFSFNLCHIFSIVTRLCLMIKDMPLLYLLSYYRLPY